MGGGGGASPVMTLPKGGGVEEVLVMLKGKYIKFRGSFNLRVLAILMGACVQKVFTL